MEAWEEEMYEERGGWDLEVCLDRMQYKGPAQESSSLAMMITR
jgi:hypothetical protein